MSEKSFEVRLGWLAGILDGESWIGFGPLRNYGSGHKHPGARWNIEICNTDAAMLAEIIAIARVLGVHVKYLHKAARKPNRKHQARVAFNSKEACWVVLNAVLPYLVTKQAQAKLMLEAISHRRALTGGDRQRPDRVAGWIPVDEDRRFLEMSTTIRNMNRRGTAPVED